MAQNKHTATPQQEFLQELWQTFLDKDDSTLTTHQQESYGSIVRAVNSHESLVEACNQMVDFLDQNTNVLPKYLMDKLENALRQAEEA